MSGESHKTGFKTVFEDADAINSMSDSLLSLGFPSEFNGSFL